MRRAGWLAAVCVAAAIGGAGLWMRGAARDAARVSVPGAPPATAGSATVTTPDGEASAAPAPAPSDAPPASLRGAEPDGALHVDAAGRFVPDRAALARFEWYLSATGEEPPGALRARIVRHLRASLPPGAAAQAEAFLDQVEGYRAAMRALFERGAAPDDLERRLQWIRETRRAHFGPELAEALFGEEERVALLDLERRAVVQDASLTPEERDAKLAAIEARLPEDVRAARASATAPVRVAKQVATLRARGGSEAEVFAVREQAFGADAAERLAALDAKREAWKARLEAWRGELAAIEADPTIPAEQKTAAIDAARKARFGEDELLRVQASERP